MTCNCKKHHKPIGAFATIPRPATITAIIVENAHTKTFVFNCDMPQAQPGQFVMASLPGIKESPFCVADNVPLTLTIAAVGPFSKAVHALGKGDALYIRGPFGTSFNTQPKALRPLLVGGGYGAAPLAFLAREMKINGLSPVAILGGRSKSAVIGAARFNALGVPVIITTDDGTEGIKGRVDKAVADEVENNGGDAIFAIGPNPMLETLEAQAKTYNIPAELSWEQHMGCGIGVCGKCEHKDGTVLCLEGPVLKTKAA